MIEPGTCKDSVQILYRDEFRRLEREAGYLHLSNAVVLGMPWLSDGALRTYCRLLSLDWASQQQVWWSKRRLALLCDLPVRTLQDHIAELVHFGLLTREERPNDTSILYIEEIPECAYRLAIYKRNIIRAKERSIWPSHESGGFLAAFIEWARRTGQDRVYAQALRYQGLAQQWRARRRRAAASAD